MSIKGYERNEDAIKASGGARFHSLATGRTVLRVLPPYSERGVWFRSILEYYIKLGDQKRILVSPKDMGLPDPLAEYGESLSQSGDERLVARAKEVRPRRRFLVNALIISDSKGAGLKDGVKIVNLPVSVKEDLRNIDTDIQAGYGNITDIEQGFNVSIERAGEGLQTRYSVFAHRERSDILKQAREQGFNPDNWTLHNLDDAVKPSSFEELQDVVALLERDLIHSGPAAQRSSFVAPAAPADPATVTVQQGSVSAPSMPFGVRAPFGGSK